MENHCRPKRILCVNCNICVNTLRRYRVFDQNTRITDDDYVCEACWELSIAAVNQNFQQNISSSDTQAGPSQRGHINVCLLCGSSIARRQSDLILRDNPTELQLNMINIIKTKIEPRQLSPSDRVCHACWLRSKRDALRISRSDPLSLPEEMPQNDTIMSQEIEPLENPRVEEISTSNIIAEIVLPDYKRAANTGNHCVYTHCTNTGKLHGIPDKLRAIILRDHKYYLPKLARICGDHLTRNSWYELYKSENSMSIFNAEQVQHIFSFVNAFNPTLDFGNIEEMDERIFQYFVGISKDDYNILLGEVPRVLEIKGGKLGLVSLLIKMKTKDSNERIAKLVQKPRRSLEVLMGQVRNVLMQEQINLRINLEAILQ